MATTTRSGHSKRKSSDIQPESAIKRFTSRITGLTTWEKLRDLESRKSVRVVCLISGVALLTGVVAAVILWSGWIENEAPLKSLASVQEVKPISAHLSRVIQSPQSLKVIHHGKAPAIYSGDCTPPECRTGPITLLILVESLPTSYGFRMAVRNSWMQYGSVDVFVRFAVAGKRLRKSTLNWLAKESATYQDLIVFLDAEEFPQSEKLLFEFFWAEQTVDYLYLMKTREQFYVRMKELVRELKRMRANTTVYWGYFEGKKSPLDGGKHPEPEWFLCNTFIRYAHAGGYIMSRQLVKRLLSLADYLQLYNNEDVAVGTWLSPFKDVHWKHDVRFNTEVGVSRGCDNNFIVFPTRDNLDMTTKHKQLMETGQYCKAAETAWGYEYNFNVLPAQCCRAL